MAIFEIGKIYEISRGDMVSYNCEVLEFDERNGLLKISQFGEIEIISISSSNFNGAKIQE
jgi:hypothetical protein